MPQPIIPQTPDQARQRDQSIGLNVAPIENAAHELARLRNAIRLHRAEITRAGELNLCPPCREKHDDTLHTKQQADEALWSHLELA